MRRMFAAIVLASLFSIGCDQSQTQGSGSKQFKELTARVEDLEGRLATKSGTQSTVAQVNDNTQAVFSDVTRVLGDGRNVRVDFAMRDYTSIESPRTLLSVYMNQYTAKRFHNALEMSLERHTKVFGELPANGDAGTKAVWNAQTANMYANFVRLTGSPEELIIDVGLNKTPVGTPSEPIQIDHSIVTDFVAADALFRQLDDLIEEYESKNGPIETDIQKRIAR